MLDILNQVGLSATLFFTIVAIATVAFVLAYRPFVLSLVDPLIMFVVASIADAVLMYGLNWEKSVKVEFTFFIVCFWIGFAIRGRIPANHPVFRFADSTLLDLEIVLLLTTVAIVLGNLYLGATAGFPIFSANPSDAKVTVYSGGLGIIRHLNQGPYLFLCCGCTLLIALGRRSTLAVTMLVVASFFLALSGSKGALLPIFFVQAFVMTHNGMPKSERYIAALKSFAIPACVGAVAVALVVLIRENGGVVDGLFGLAKRLLFFGDVILFYYPNRGAIHGLANIGPMDYFHYLLDPILGMFRLADYGSISPPLGSVIANAEDGIGPNAQYFVRADIFFGPVAGCVYCLVIGYLCAFLRRQFFTFRPTSAMTFTFSLVLAVAAVDIPFESSLFLSTIVDTLLFVAPLWCFAHIATLSTEPGSQAA